MNFLELSFKVLERFHNKPGRNLKLTLSRELDRMDAATKKERGIRQAVTRTVYGVVRHHHLLAHLLQQVSDRKWRKIQTPVRVRLETGGYLLLFSGSYPDYAVVNEVVEHTAGKARGFVNAVLRKVVKKKKNLLNTMEHLTDLSVRYSASPFLVEALRQISDDPAHDLDYLSREPLFHLRINPAGVEFNDAARSLSEKEMEFKELEAFWTFEIKEAGAIVPEMESGNRFYFQNTASQLIAVLAARYARRGILDCCAAPGTKAVTAALLNPKLTIFANDINPDRAGLICDTVARFGLENVKTVVSDLTEVAFKDNGAVDFIMVDAPCTSAGTLRKNPDLKIKIDEERVKRNTKAQVEILNALLSAFAENSGYFLYSVCSFIKEETEDILEKVFSGREFKAVDFTQILDEFGFRYKQGKYGIYLLPDDRLNNDLFYISLSQPSTFQT
jgi:16S rRNA (cytosine967-C5)-methyltransferase